MQNHAEEERIKSPDSTATDASAPGLKSSVCGTPEPTPDNPPSAEVIATEAGRRIARDYPQLDRRGRLRIVSTFRRQLIPPRKPGRKRREEITAAYADWKLGLRGLELYRKHIAGLERMSRWKRESKMRTLRDAIRSRERRTSKQETRIRSADLWHSL